MFEFIIFGTLVIVGYTVGSRREAAHYKSIEEREKQLLYLPVRANKAIYHQAQQTQLMMASVVVANDYFKTVATSVKSFFGGQIRSQESLLDRARREATLRLKQKARVWGAVEVIGFRMDTCMIENAGVEIFVYGTAIKNDSL